MFLEAKPPSTQGPTFSEFEVRNLTSEQKVVCYSKLIFTGLDPRSVETESRQFYPHSVSPLEPVFDSHRAVGKIVRSRARLADRAVGH